MKLIKGKKLKETKFLTSILIIIAIIIIIIGGYFFLIPNNLTPPSNSQETGPGDLSSNSFPQYSAIENTKDEIQTTDSGTKFIVDPINIRSGGPPKDGIPSIDNPKFVTVPEADQWIEDRALVLALVYKGEERAYPLQIMSWHEIVNDVIAGDPIAVTYCPLCGSGIAYYRVLDGSPVQFGTSGKLFNSNLVMYDRKTNSYWQQIDGKAIVGPQVGKELQELSVDTVPWRDWKKFHPNSKVLSKNTGYVRNYASDTYANYYEDDFYLFPGIENKDSTNRIKNKDAVLGIEISGVYKAYRETDVEEKGLIEDTISGVQIKIEKLEDGRFRITNIDTGEEIVKERDFWFAWYAFHPETELYGF
jgi:hypothetical protein